ncbi:MAG: sulfotransferase domain-containing protein [Myxococcota bacterium]
MTLRIALRGVFKPRLSVFGAKYLPSARRKDARADVILAWFPKTGGTWTRLLLGAALAEDSEDRDLLDLETLTVGRPDLPIIRPLHEDEPHWKRPEQLTRSKARWRHKKVILLIRDPRDTMVSLYFQMTRRWKVTTKPMDELIWDRRGGLETMLAYYNIWADQRHVPKDLLLVRYEDLHADTPAQLSRMVSFLGVDRDEATVQKAVEASRFSRMRKRESAGEFSSSRLRAGIANDPESLKARKGKVGGYVDYLSEAQVTKIEARVNEALNPWYGYAAVAKGSP